MQISAANLLASQQVRPAQQPANAAVQKAKKPDGNGFETLLFKQAAKPNTPASPASVQPTQSYGAAQRPGSQLDIRI
jgi:hypothetical protein